MNNLKKGKFFLAVAILTGCLLASCDLPNIDSQTSSETSTSQSLSTTSISSPEVESFIVTYHLNGGEMPDGYQTSITVNGGETLDLPTPSKLGYTFIGWFIGEDEMSSQFTSNDTVSSNLDLYARYQIVTYTITYELNGGSLDVSNPTTYTIEDEFVLNIPRKTGHSFVSWIDTNGNRISSISKGSTGNLVLTANWMVNSYTITLDSNGGTCEVSSLTLTYGEEYSLPTPRKDGYKFQGWFYLDQEVNLSGSWPYDFDLTLVANYKSESPFEYEIINNEITITGYSGADVNVAVPSEMNGYKVTGIASKAFANLYSIQSVVIPSSVTSIGVGAFSACSSLTSITIPFVGASLEASGSSALFGYIFGYFSSYGGTEITQYYDSSSQRNFYIPTTLREVIVTGGEIKNGAFDSCHMLTSITLEEGVTGLGMYAFRRCNGLTSMTLPNTVTKIGRQAFYSCEGLISISLTNNLVSIEYMALSNCYKLSSLTIPGSILTMDDYAFASNTALTSVVLEEGVTKVGNRAFSNCQNLTEVSLPTTLKSIGFFAFYSCKKLANITIPEGVETIDHDAFSDCVKLNDVTLPSSLTSISHHLFASCKKLASITIPSNVTSIGYSAFYSCSSLASIVIPDNVLKIEDSVFEYCTSLTSVTLGKGLTSLGAYSFRGCTSLTSIVIPSNVVTIGNYAFAECDSLSIFSEAAAKPSGWNTNWNSSNRPVYWASEWHYVDGVPTPNA